MQQQKKLRLIIFSLKDSELLQLFNIYAQNIGSAIKKDIKSISQNSYEATITISSISTNGYGKTPNEAFVSGVSNHFSYILIDPKNQKIVQKCFRQMSKVRRNSHNRSLSSTQMISKSHNLNQNGKQKYTQLQRESLKQNKFQSLKYQSFKVFQEAIIKPQLANQRQIKLKESQLPNKNNNDIDLHARIRQLEKQLSAAQEDNLALKRRLYHQQNRKEHQNKQAIGRAKEKQKQNYQWAQFNNQKSIVKQPKQSKAKNITEISKLVQYCHTNNNLDDSWQASIKAVRRESSKKMKRNEEIENGMINRIGANWNKREQNKSIRSNKMIKRQLNSSMNEQVDKELCKPSSSLSKVYIPKLNLQVLPNYHGKSKKSLNQSLIQNYQKKQKLQN